MNCENFICGVIYRVGSPNQVGWVGFDILTDNKYAKNSYVWSFYTIYAVSFINSIALCPFYKLIKQQIIAMTNNISWYYALVPWVKKKLDMYL